MTERFAPSPTGLLHLGHAFSALAAWDAAQKQGHPFLLRIEDIDQPRCKDTFEQAIYDDLAWLGLTWPTPVLRQSDHLDRYNDALDQLIQMGLCYPCQCSRKDIQNALSAPQEGIPAGPDGIIYPGTCASRVMQTRNADDAIRLNMAAVVNYLGGTDAVQNLSYVEIGTGQSETIALNAHHLIHACGDIVLARRDIGTSYHLAVVVDDALQNITTVTRGKDMQSATPIHVILQTLLGYSTPIYHHHRLIRDQTGKRLAKRDQARALQQLRAQGKTPQDIRDMFAL